MDKAADLLPDIVLMDVRMPKRGGIEACTSIKEVAPSAKIIMLTISDEEADLYDAIKAGATGYLLKEISTDEVATAIRAVADGQSQISPSMASKLLTEFKSMIQRTDERRLVPAPRLTDRELEVLKLVATGMNNRDIAKELFISENTVKNHVRNILEKLQLHSRMEAVVYAMREKILENQVSEHSGDRPSPGGPAGRQVTADSRAAGQRLRPAPGGRRARSAPRRSPPSSPPRAAPRRHRRHGLRRCPATPAGPPACVPRGPDRPGRAAGRPTAAAWRSSRAPASAGARTPPAGG